jgi:hypothetical protein
MGVIVGFVIKGLGIESLVVPLLQLDRIGPTFLGGLEKLFASIKASHVVIAYLGDDKGIGSVGDGFVSYP